jgi:hypothetical protein
VKTHKSINLALFIVNLYKSIFGDAFYYGFIVCEFKSFVVVDLL